MFSVCLSVSTRLTPATQVKKTRRFGRKQASQDEGRRRGRKDNHITINMMQPPALMGKRALPSRCHPITRPG
eukprot:11861375-Prorocentrum_lima.AAC.1